MKTLPKPLNVILVFLLMINGIQAFSQTSASASNTSFTIENYYKIRWGYEEEFIQLYKKNHYPLLKKALEKGDILKIVAEKPRLHSGEETRWDFRVILVFKNQQAAFDPNLTEPYKKQLYPDLEKLKKDEQHRFELLQAHWDILTQGVNLDQ